MFYYYGRKKQLAGHYPPPQYSTIVEPFAGAAAYSLHGDNWKSNVTLIEKDERVSEIWSWLINEATEQSIRRLPTLRQGERSSEFLHIIHAATKMAFHYQTIKVTAVLERNWEISKRIMARDLHKVKHWTIICADYTSAPDIEGTWFIDPPYRGPPGHGYRWGSDTIDYRTLAKWARRRKGQVIFCEGENGAYLPFRPLRDCKGVAGKTSFERVWHRPSPSRAKVQPFQLDLIPGEAV